MREQYHFWPGEHGLDAWDVDRLIELSKALPVKDVKLASIDEIDSVYWFDDTADDQRFGTWWTTLGSSRMWTCPIPSFLGSTDV